MEYYLLRTFLPTEDKTSFSVMQQKRPLDYGIDGSSFGNNKNSIPT